MKNFIKYLTVFGLGVILSLSILTFLFPKTPITIIPSHGYSIYNIENDSVLTIEQFYTSAYCKESDIRKIVVKLPPNSYAGIYCDKNLMLLLNSDEAIDKN